MVSFSEHLSDRFEYPSRWCIDENLCGSYFYPARRQTRIAFSFAFLSHRKHKISALSSASSMCHHLFQGNVNKTCLCWMSGFRGNSWTVNAKCRDISVSPQIVTRNQNINRALLYLLHTRQGVVQAVSSAGMQQHSAPTFSYFYKTHYSVHSAFHSQLTQIALWLGTSNIWVC